MGRDLTADPGRGSTNGSLLVEFVGLPGAGKSTLATRVVEALQTQEIYPCSPVAEINCRSTFNRLTSKTMYAGRSGLTRPLITSAAIRTTGFRRLFSTGDSRSVLFNWLFIHGVIERYRRSEDVVILDQGLLQAYWSARLSETDAFCNHIRWGILDKYAHTPILVVNIQVSPETIQTRLDDRDPNPSRVKPDQEGKYSITDATQAYTRTRDLMNSVAKQNDNAESLTISNENMEDIEPNVKKISGRIQTLL